MNNKLITLCLLFVLMACTERIEIATKDSPSVIVIYGMLTDELKHQEVKLSRSSPYFSAEPNPGVSGAKVTVRSSENITYSFLENDTVAGLYYSQNPFIAKIGVDYFLSVEVDFNHTGKPDLYEAQTTILPAVPIDSLTLEPFEWFGQKRYILYAHFEDPPEVNFYLFNVYRNDSLLTAKISGYLCSDDALFAGQHVKGNIRWFGDVSDKGKELDENQRYRVYLSPGDTVKIECNLISRGYFDFINQCQLEKEGENPMFGGPASNIETNISNGGVGYFFGYSISRQYCVFE